MAFDFPSSPTLGQEFTPASGATYVWNGYGWGPKLTGVTVSDTPPSTASDNSLWYESDSGRLYFRYNDGNTQQWVSVGGTGPAGGTPITVGTTPPASPAVNQLWVDTT